jgi:hypothetical protein
MGVLYTHPLRSPSPYYMSFKKRPLKKNFKNEDQFYFFKWLATVRRSVWGGRPPSHRPRLAAVYWLPGWWRPTIAAFPYTGAPFLPGCFSFFFSFFPHFWALWSTPPHWLQHMPALPRLLLKTSNIHNF